MFDIYSGHNYALCALNVLSGWICAQYYVAIIIIIINYSNYKCVKCHPSPNPQPNFNPNLSPYPTQNPKPNQYTLTLNSLLLEISQSEQLPLEQMLCIDSTYIA